MAPSARNRCVIVGVPTEVKPDEYRVALTPAGVRELADAGHRVLVQSGAGSGSAISDEAYAAQGATIVPDAVELFGGAELIVKVKEPQPAEVELLEPRHTLFTYLHLAADPALTRALMESGATCLGYETVEDERGRLPLLAPMSEVAGKIATQAGAFMLEKPLGGRGILLGGVPGVAAANVMIIGGGVVGMNAAFIALGMEATVYVYDRNIDRLRELDIALARPGRHVLCDHAVDRGAAARGRPGHRCGARPRSAGATGHQPRPASADASARRCWSTSRSTRAAALRPPGPRPTPTRCTRWTASRTTA